LRITSWDNPTKLLLDGGHNLRIELRREAEIVLGAFQAGMAEIGREIRQRDTKIDPIGDPLSKAMNRIAMTLMRPVA
jgi:hypothetical protein